MDHQQRSVERCSRSTEPAPLARSAWNALQSGGLFTLGLEQEGTWTSRAAGWVPRTPAVSAAGSVWPAIRRRCGSGRATGAR
jgi:hypothetical protein